MLVGSNIGPFHIEKELGSGAMGTVYRAQFNNEGKIKTVALKMVSIALLGDEKAMARFEREANILKQLKHPHIVRLLATGKYKSTPFIAMEFVDGESMDRVLARRGRLGWDEVFTYAKQLCDALQHAHERGIIHRDLKPSNLMITKSGVLKLTDFGIAKDTDVTALTGANSAIGTAAYMSPEQCRGDKSLSAKSDLYSLGVCMYELITGRKPFTAETSMEMFLKHVNDVPLRPSKYMPDLPVWADNLIMFLLEKKPDNRPLDAATVSRMIADIESKVQDQKSVGLEVATGRRVDRKPTEYDEADRDAARAIRGKKKKKKKLESERGKSIGTIIAFASIVLVVVGLLVWQLWPASLASAYARVESADADSKLDSVAEFLKKHAGKTGPEIDKANALFKQQLVDYGERQLTRRHERKMTKAEDGDNVELLDLVWLAYDSEETGDLTRASDCWKKVRDKSSDPQANAYTEKANAARLGLKWIAEKRAADIESLNARVEAVQNRITSDRFEENRRTFEPADPEGLAYIALWLERVGDPWRARNEWESLIKLAGKDPIHHQWWLIAKSHVRAISADTTKDTDARNKRITLITKRFTEAANVWETVKTRPEMKRERYDSHNLLFETSRLFATDPESELKSLADRASQLLTKYPKSMLD